MLEHVKAGEPIKASGWNSLVDGISSPNIAAGTGLLANNHTGTHIALSKQPDDYWIGKVVTSGPNSASDFTTAQYWIARQTLLTATSSSYPCTQAQLCEGAKELTWTPAPFPWNDTVCATNLAETLSNTHFVPVGQYVQVFEEWDSGNPATLRYKFTMTPPPFLGMIVAEGECSEAEPTDNTYWCRRQTINLDDDDYTDAIDSDAVSDVTDPALNPCQSSDPCSPDESCTPNEDNRHQVILVTNLAEQNNQTHLIPHDTIVEVTWAVDAGGMPRYTMTVPGPQIFTLKITGICGGLSIGGSSGGGGRYMVSVGSGQVVGLNDTTDFPGADYNITFAGSAVWCNHWEQKPLSGSHALPNGTVVSGYFVGYDNGTPALPVYYGELCPPLPQACGVSQYGGDNASSPTAYATYTYTVNDLVTNQFIGQGMTPSWQRPQGVLTGPATSGFYIVINGGATLLTTDEQAQVGVCT